jgi:uncharacterized ferritin-like protein (DUF455 family)
LDAGPRLVERLMGFGDARSASIAKHIAEEEVAHVAVGVSWFLSVCKQLGMNPASRFQGSISHGVLVFLTFRWVSVIAIYFT